LFCLGRRSQPLAGFPAHPISLWNQVACCAQPSRSISLASSSPVRECAPSIPVPKLVYNLPACSWWELAAVPLSSRPWWSPMVAPSAPSRCARRGSCSATEQSATWSSPAPYLAFFWSAFLSLNYGCVVSIPGLVELGACLLSFSSHPAQLHSRSSSPFPFLPWKLAAAARFLWCAQFAGQVPSPVVSSPRVLAVDLAWSCIVRLVNHGRCRTCLSRMHIARYLDLAD
jgi:hypothetical protein